MVLSLNYRHDCDLRPSYLSHPLVQAVANEVRHQLGVTGMMPLPTLAGIDQVVVNRVGFRFEVCLDHPVHDQDQAPVLGLCDYDPGERPDVVSLLVNPELAQVRCRAAREELMLSTLAHELGHGVFDAPAWVARAAQPPLVGPADPGARSAAYRSITRNEDHLRKLAPLGRAEHFAELRANEFMGALLVPRARLVERLRMVAADLRIPLVTKPRPADLFGSTDNLPEALAPGLTPTHIGFLCGTLSGDFGVSARFIEVRLRRYGLLDDPRPLVA